MVVRFDTGPGKTKGPTDPPKKTAKELEAERKKAHDRVWRDLEKYSFKDQQKLYAPKDNLVRPANQVNQVNAGIEDDYRTRGAEVSNDETVDYRLAGSGTADLYTPVFEKAARQRDEAADWVSVGGRFSEILKANPKMPLRDVWSEAIRTDANMGGVHGRAKGTYAQAPASGRKRALIVANHNYIYDKKNASPDGYMWPDLGNSLSDGLGVARAYLEAGYATHGIRNTTGAKLNALFDELMASMKSGDEVFFYFAGHGTSYGMTGVDVTGPKDQNHMLSNRWLAEAAAAAVERGARFVAVTDCCHAGAVQRHFERFSDDTERTPMGSINVHKEGKGDATREQHMMDRHGVKKPKPINQRS